MGASLFVTPLLRHACPPSLPSPQEAAALAGWGAAILGRLDIDSMKKAVVKLLECEAAFLEVLAAEGEASWAEGEAALAPALRRRAELAAEATALAKAKGELAGVRPAVRALPRARPLGARRWCCVPPPPRTSPLPTSAPPLWLLCSLGAPGARAAGRGCRRGRRCTSSAGGRAAARLLRESAVGQGARHAGGAGVLGRAGRRRQQGAGHRCAGRARDWAVRARFGLPVLPAVPATPRPCVMWLLLLLCLQAPCCPRRSA